MLSLISLPRGQRLPIIFLPLIAAGMGVRPGVFAKGIATRQDSSAAPMSGFDGADWPYLLSVFLALGLIGTMLASSFLAKFDFTDEGNYLYAMTHPTDPVWFFIDAISGHFGELFYNNIIVWRFIGFALLVISAGTFTDSIYRLLVVSELLGRSRKSQFALLLAGYSGVAFFYAYGPPTFSYRSAGSAAILLLYSGLIRALLAGPGVVSRHVWSAVGGFAAVLFVSARPPAAVIYPLAGIPLIWLGWRLRGPGSIARLIGLHGVYVLAFGALMSLAVIGWSTTAGFFAAPSDASHRFGALLLQHWNGLSNAATMALALALPLVAGSTLAAALMGSALRLQWHDCTSVFRSVLTWAAALLPLSLLWLYGREWRALSLKLDCLPGQMLVCQGPTPAFGGLQLVPLASAQLLCVASAALAGIFAARIDAGPSGSRNTTRAPTLLIMAFLVLLAPVASTFTNVGLVYHMILTLAPLIIAVVAACGLARFTYPGTGRGIVPVALALYTIVGGVLAVHNSVIFPGRVEGSLFEQTVRLDSPPSLAGLRVHPDTAAAIAWARDSLQRNGYDWDKDVLLTAYNVPGLAVATGVRAFGYAKFFTGLEAYEDNACRQIEADPVDLAKVGRLFLLTNGPLSGTLAACLRTRGIDLTEAHQLGTFAMTSGSKLALSVVKYRAPSP